MGTMILRDEIQEQAITAIICRAIMLLNRLFSFMNRGHLTLDRSCWEVNNIDLEILYLQLLTNHP